MGDFRGLNRQERLDDGAGEGQAKGSSDEERGRGEEVGIRARRSSHSWHAKCNVTRRCPYLFAIISARFHRSGYGRCGVSWPGDIQKYYVGTYGIARRDGCTTIQAGIRPVILQRRCENRSCVTTSTGSPMGSSRTTVRLSSVSSVSPVCFVTSP